MGIFATKPAGAVLLIAGTAIAAVSGFNAGPAQAQPNWDGSITWCPGQKRPPLPPWPNFDWTVCHNYTVTRDGILDLDTGIQHGHPGGNPAPPAPNWCPGDPIPGGFAPEDTNWDPTVCHRIKWIPDPGSLVMDEPNDHHVIAGDPRPGCPRAAQVAPLPCL